MEMTRIERKASMAHTGWALVCAVLFLFLPYTAAAVERGVKEEYHPSQQDSDLSREEEEQQSRKDGKRLRVDYEVSAHAGWLMPDGKVDKMTGEAGSWYGPVYGGDVSVTFRPEWQSLRDWNGAGVGVGLSYRNMGHPLMGHAIAPYTYLDIPIIRLARFSLGIHSGIGAAFMTKTYRNTVSESAEYQSLEGANQSIGSVFNFYFPEALYIGFPIAGGWSVFARGGWYHISNGSIRQPNSGYNIFSASAGVRYAAGEEPTVSRVAEKSGKPARAWEVEMSFTGGGRQVYYKDRQTFFVGEIQAAAYWRAHAIFRLGGGVDVFYDGAYVRREVSSSWKKTNYAGADADGKDCWRVGVSIQPEFVVGRLTAGLHVGAYLYDPVRELEPYDEAVASPSGRIAKPLFYRYDLWKAGSAGYADGWLYTQVVVRYHLPWHVFVQGTMKSHVTKVEFVSVGVGVCY